MEIARNSSCLLLRLEHGEDVLRSIAQAVEEDPSTMVIVTGLGMIVDFELGFFDNGSYVKKHFKEPHELLSYQGSVASEGENRLHIHATVASREHEAFGGHLLGGRVWMSNEIALLSLEGTPSRRELDEAKRVGILHLSR